MGINVCPRAALYHTHSPGQLQMVMASQTAAPRSLQNSSLQYDINTKTTALQAILLTLLISVEPAYCSILNPGQVDAGRILVDCHSRFIIY